MTQAPNEQELWQVAFGPGDVRTLTLDQLDEAFARGLVDEMTLLCELGTSDWQPLYAVAGLDPPVRETAVGAPAPPAPGAAPAPASVPKPAPASVPKPAPASASKPAPASIPRPMVPAPKPPTRAGSAPVPSSSSQAVTLRGPTPISNSTAKPASSPPRPAAPRPASSRPPLPATPPKIVGPAAPAPEAPRGRQPSLVETAAAVVAATGTTLRPPEVAKPSAPPLPKDAFAHLAARALADVAAPAAESFTQNAPPQSTMTSTAPFGPPPVAAVVDVAPQSFAAPPAASADAVASVADVPDLQSSPSIADASSGIAGGRWIIAIAALATLSIVLQRNGLWYDLSRAAGMESTYLGIEKAVFGEPSIETPRGIERLLRESTRHDAPSAP